MSVQLRKVELQNFKLYKNRFFDFENQSLVVFDGPNGFGKSSFFDAIELLITGSIRRYRSLNINDNRERRVENPFYYEKGDGSPIVIKALLLIGDEEICIARKNENVNNPVVNFSDYRLYKLESFDDEFTDENEIEESELEAYFGSNYKSDFEFIHYVEQEDTFHFIKQKKEKEKKSSLDYLFNTGDFEQKIEAFQSVLNRLSSFEAQFNENKKVIEEENKIINEQLKPNEEVQYEQLFEEKRFIWDSEEIDFKSTNYAEIINEETGVLNRLETFAKNKDLFIKYLKNIRIQKLITSPDLSLFYNYYMFLSEYDNLSVQRNIRNDYIELKKSLEQFEIDLVGQDEYSLTDNFKSKYLDQELIEEYQEKLNLIKEASSNSTTIQKIYSRINDTRENLDKHLKQLRENQYEHSECLFCGYDWKSVEDLDKAINQEKLELEKINKNLENDLSKKVKEFIDFVQNSFFPEIDKQIEEFMYVPNYFKDDFFKPNAIKQIDIIRKEFDDLSIDYSDQLSNEIKANTDQEFDVFKELVEKSKVDLGEFQGEVYEDLYNDYFNSSLSEYETFEVDSIRNKRLYVEWKHSVHLNEKVSENIKKIGVLNERITKIEEPSKNLKKIINNLQKSLDEYKAELVKDVELLFHVYSGRVMQDFHMGLGLFLLDKGDKIKFVTAPNKSFDAVFSMSTGQLSSLILAFTLALNKKYSKSKLLFIDDPVQSMDDINTAGFIDVLRNDFKDRQVFVSTHEEMMSSFIRYKYKMFNLESSRVDLSRNVVMN